jgi:hypothetical protein
MHRENKSGLQKQKIASALSPKGAPAPPAPLGRTAPRGPQCFGDFFARSARSRARRAAVRLRAAASDAFLARAERSSGVIVSRLRLPPILPPLRPISRMISENSALVFLSIEPYLKTV